MGDEVASLELLQERQGQGKKERNVLFEKLRNLEGEMGGKVNLRLFLAILSIIAMCCMWLANSMSDTAKTTSESVTEIRKEITGWRYDMSQTTYGLELEYELLKRRVSQVEGDTDRIESKIDAP